jgi:hypothetical protein
LATLTFIAASGDTFPKQIALKFPDGINASGQYGIQVLYTLADNPVRDPEQSVAACG